MVGMWYYHIPTIWVLCECRMSVNVWVEQTFRTLSSTGGASLRSPIRWSSCGKIKFYISMWIGRLKSKLFSSIAFGQKVSLFYAFNTCFFFASMSTPCKTVSIITWPSVTDSTSCNKLANVYFINFPWFFHIFPKFLQLYSTQHNPWAVFSGFFPRPPQTGQYVIEKTERGLWQGQGGVEVPESGPTW